MDLRAAQGMGYEEALEARVTRREARREILKHDLGMDFEDAWELFVAEHGEHDTYLGGDVLGWLGY